MVNPIMDTAPMGSGFSIHPIMVAIKIANICHALIFTPEGAGIIQIITPTATDINSLIYLLLELEVVFPMTNFIPFLQFIFEFTYIINSKGLHVKYCFFIHL